MLSLRILTLQLLLKQSRHGTPPVDPQLRSKELSDLTSRQTIWKSEGVKDG